ncbi:MAG TPA: hypothetical protein VIN59_06240 [Alphaproteobacteria bacterium]
MNIAKTAFLTALIATPVAAQDVNYPDVFPNDFAEGRVSILECDNQADGFFATAFEIAGSKEFAVYITDQKGAVEAANFNSRKDAEDKVRDACIVGPQARL